VEKPIKFFQRPIKMEKSRNLVGNDDKIEGSAEKYGKADKFFQHSKKIRKTEIRRKLLIKLTEAQIKNL